MTSMGARGSSLHAVKPAPDGARWGFLTNYAVLLAYVVLHPESTVRAIAQGIGITERSALTILRDLDDEEIVYRYRDGRRNTYSVDFERLAAVKRGGDATAQTPRLFVNGIVNMLFDMATQHGTDVARSTVPHHTQERDLKERTGAWGFFTNHMLVLLAIARDPSRTVRELAVEVAVTERAVVGIINQLESERIVRRWREGRRTRYSLDFDGFRAFRGWSFGEWSIAPSLVDAAIVAIEGLGRGD
jgi:DNA-binding MarR family transcriptional regulator